ncbi:MAG: flagellar basal body rod protein FlgB [Acidobacteriota bacterium]
MKLTELPLLDELKRYLDLSIRKQKLINSNLANVDTPGYRAANLEFEQMLRLEMDEPWMNPDSRHFRDRPVLLRGVVTRGETPGAIGNDLNNVDADHELVELAQNLLKFSTVTQIYQKTIQGLRFAIREGR